MCYNSFLNKLSHVVWLLGQAKRVKIRYKDETINVPNILKKYI